jgi:hypothetical protein
MVADTNEMERGGRSHDLVRYGPTVRPAIR